MNRKKRRFKRCRAQFAACFIGSSIMALIATLLLILNAN
jgi:hypothetical protein